MVCKRVGAFRLASYSFAAALILAGCNGSPPPANELGTHMLAASNPAGNLDQCANGPLSAPQQCTGSAWSNGNLNQNQAHYLENQSVPYRLRLSNLATGSTHHVVRIEWDTSQGGAHALDYI